MHPHFLESVRGEKAVRELAIAAYHLGFAYKIQGGSLRVDHQTVMWV